MATVKVTNVSPKATQHDILDFFSFSGEIQNIELERDGGGSQVAYVTFKEAQALDTALLLSGAVIVDQAVNIFPLEDEVQTASTTTSMRSEHKYTESRSEYAGLSSGHSQNSAQDVIASMLARGFILGKDVMGKARAFDEKHQLTASATATVSNFDRKTGITEKLSAGTQAVNQQLKAVDQKFSVSEKTRSAFAAAEQKVNTAGSVLMKNRYVLTGATWVTGAFSRVSKAAADVSQKTKEKAAILDKQEGRSGQTAGSADNEYQSTFGGSYDPPATHPTLEHAVDARYPNLGYDQYAPLPSTYAPISKPPPAHDSFL
ncbi:hypothetical protein BDL97_02G020100 [Sphagnum fallax]|nr:hypothetical protein BDL97_02G020100 [Sphagnum fallax]